MNHSILWRYVFFAFFLTIFSNKLMGTNSPPAEIKNELSSYDLAFINHSPVIPDDFFVKLESLYLNCYDKKYLDNKMKEAVESSVKIVSKYSFEASIITTDIIKSITSSQNIMTIAGGGDTIAAIKKSNAENSFTYLSTAGGAFLEWLEGKESPGVKALKENNLF